MNRRSPISSRGGFTIVEMALALGLTIGISGVIVAMLSQQVSFARALGEFRFLQNDAPKINTLLTNIINKADQYRIYPDLSAAKNSIGAVRSGGSALRLRFRHPDGTSDHAIISFETRNGEDQLNYYFRDKNDNSWPSQPSWTLSTQPETVTFDNSTGILLVTLTGDSGDQITYSGNPD